MTFLLAIVLTGIAFGYFATQNTMGTTIHFLGNAWGNIPVYLVVLGALLAGFFISWIVSGIDNLFSFFALHGKDSELKKQDRVLTDLENKVRDLELENTKLREDQKHTHNHGVFVEKPTLTNPFRHKVSA